MHRYFQENNAAVCHWQQSYFFKYKATCFGNALQHTVPSQNLQRISPHQEHDLLAVFHKKKKGTPILSSRFQLNWSLKQLSYFLPLLFQAHINWNWSPSVPRVSCRSYCGKNVFTETKTKTKQSWLLSLTDSEIQNGFACSSFFITAPWNHKTRLTLCFQGGDNSVLMLGDPPAHPSLQIEQQEGSPAHCRGWGSPRGRGREQNSPSSRRGFFCMFLL